MSILTEEQTQQIIDGALDQIKQAVIGEATEEASWRVKTAAGNAVTEIVTTFVKEEVAPEILTSLRERKSVLVNAAIASAENMAAQLAEAMSQKLAENLGGSYSRKKILEAMFD